MPRHKFPARVALIGLLTIAPASAQFSAKSDECGQRTVSILQGDEVLGDINNVTIWERGFVDEGPIGGLDKAYPRNEILAITHKGEHLSKST